MRQLLAASMLGCLLAGSPAFAGSDHEHGGHEHQTISKDQAAEKAKQKLDQLVTGGKLDKSWSSVAVKTVEQKTFEKGPEWVVTFVNDTVADEAKRTLYMFYDVSGHYLAANFTGN